MTESDDAEQITRLTRHPLYDPHLGIEIYKYYNPLLGCMTQLEEEWNQVLQRNGYEVGSLDGRIHFMLVIYVRDRVVAGRPPPRRIRWSYALEISIHHVDTWTEAKCERWRNESIGWIDGLAALRDIRGLLKRRYHEVTVDLYWIRNSLLTNHDDL